jgi:hypothetical protein
MVPQPQKGGQHAQPSSRWGRSRRTWADGYPPGTRVAPPERDVADCHSRFSLLPRTASPVGPAAARAPGG